MLQKTKSPSPPSRFCNPRVCTDWKNRALLGFNSAIQIPRNSKKIDQTLLMGILHIYTYIYITINKNISINIFINIYICIQIQYVCRHISFQNTSCLVLDFDKYKQFSRNISLHPTQKAHRICCLDFCKKMHRIIQTLP